MTPAQAGDAVAIGVLALLGRRVGIGVANAINTFDPDVVAIGGGVSAAGELLLGPAKSRMGVRPGGRRHEDGDPPRPIGPPGRSPRGGAPRA